MMMTIFLLQKDKRAYLEEGVADSVRNITKDIEEKKKVDVMLTLRNPYMTLEIRRQWGKFRWIRLRALFEFVQLC